MDRSIRNSNKNVFGAEASFHAWWWYFEFYNTINKIDDIRRWVIQRQVGPRIFRHIIVCNRIYFLKENSITEKTALHSINYQRTSNCWTNSITLFLSCINNNLIFICCTCKIGLGGVAFYTSKNRRVKWMRRPLLHYDSWGILVAICMVPH